ILFLPTLLPTLDNYTQLGIYSRSHSNLPLGRLRLPEDIPGPLCIMLKIVQTINICTKKATTKTAHLFFPMLQPTLKK
ncbi:hypothetical protein, partial [Zobellia barbeyronii]|uniref:hypothetical protein n=1 Tax=Zobellia barbeyronii TaxID=2748009 RepID=UPI001BE0C042